MAEDCPPTGNDCTEYFCNDENRCEAQLLPGCECPPNAVPSAGPTACVCDDAPKSFTVDLGATSGSLTLDWSKGGTIADEISVWYEGRKVGTSGCTPSTDSTTFPFSGTTTAAMVFFEPQCDGNSGTVWNFSLSCAE